MTENTTTLSPVQQAEQVASLLRKADETTAVCRADAAVIVRDLDTAGQVGKSGTWNTWGAFADAVGTSEGNVSGLRNLGLALELGVSRDDGMFSVLSRRAGTKAVRAAVKAEGATAESIMSAVRAAYDAKGNPIAATDARGANGSATEPSDTAGTGGDAPAPVESRPLTVDEALDALKVAMRGLDKAALDEVGKRVAGLLKAERAVAAKAAKAADAA